MPQGRHIQHFLQRTLKRENKFKTTKIAAFILQRGHIWFLHILFLPIPYTDNWKDKKLSIQKCSYWQSCQLQTVLDLVEGEGVVFANP